MEDKLIRNEDLNSINAIAGMLDVSGNHKVAEMLFAIQSRLTMAKQKYEPDED